MLQIRFDLWHTDRQPLRATDSQAEAGTAAIAIGYAVACIALLTSCCTALRNAVVYIPGCLDTADCCKGVASHMNRLLLTTPLLARAVYGYVLALFG
jgi:hypothetical protein